MEMPKQPTVVAKIDEDSIRTAPTLFTNHVDVRATNQDLTITLTVRQPIRAKRIEGEDGSRAEVPCRAVAHVIVTREHAKGIADTLLRALQETEGGVG